MDIAGYVLAALATLIILTIHEYSHAYAAYKLGDNTARSLGRLSLNPIKHLDIVGALCMVFFHFGWAKPVPINPRNFKKPRRDFAITALAGPLSNVVFAFIAALLALLSIKLYYGITVENEFVYKLIYNGIQFLCIFCQINIGIAIFNLIPVPPLDGSRILTATLPPKIYFGIMKYERYIYFILIGWLFLGSYVARALLSIPFVAANPVLSFIAGLFSLSGLLSKLIATVYYAIFDLWQLIPFLQY